LDAFWKRVRGGRGFVVNAWGKREAPEPGQTLDLDEPAGAAVLGDRDREAR
jgi:hypothetical protein